MSYNENDAYKQFYMRISKPFRESAGLGALINWANRILTAVTAATYLSMLMLLFFKRDGRLWTLTLVPAIGFALLSLIRKWINRPRPYESHEIIPLIPKDSKGNSMPSRHVFSMTIIAFAIMQVNLAAGIGFAAFSLILGLIRIVTGVHYPSDVAVAYLSGCLAGSVMFFL